MANPTPHLGEVPADSDHPTRVVTAGVDFSRLTCDQALRQLSVTTSGLSQHEAGQRQAQFGLNQIKDPRKRSLLWLFIRQFRSVLVLVLIIAALLSYLTGNIIDVYVIMMVVLIDAGIGFYMEVRAENAVASLKKMLSPLAKVIRDGRLDTINARELVPGDIIRVEEGDNVAADARLIEARNIRTLEASLTGESLPETKFTDALQQKTPMADQKNMLWKGTFVVGGYGMAVVTATGTETEIGKVAQALSAIKAEPSHFQKKINRLASQMGLASVFFAIVLFIVGYFTLTMPLNELLLVSIAAMVSVIPEGLPSIIAVVLGIGTRRMARRNAIVREFTSTETLGAVSTIITDKTGTLTENALTARKIFLPGDVSGHDTEVTGEGWFPAGNFIRSETVVDPQSVPGLRQLLKISAFSNNSSITHKAETNTYELAGDPTEGALLVLARKGGVAQAAAKKLDDLPFDANLKLRASLIQNNDQQCELLVVGAPEKIIALSTKVLHAHGEKRMDIEEEQVLKDKIAEWTSQSMRVIALASKPVACERIDPSEVADLVFVGLVGMLDPARPEVRSAIQNCRKAGIRVVMATGDHISTAVAIARLVGIIDHTGDSEILALTEEQLLSLDDAEFDNAIKTINVFARLTPSTKLKIAGRLQEMGELVAMTGDGVNDAPALKKADVGIAMGIMGTDVARDSARVVLADDNFASIVNAIEEGRIVFTNARQASFFLITTNLAEIATLIVAVAFGLPIPLTAIQILWLNVVTDGIGDMALAAEKGHGEVLTEKPLKKNESVISKNILPFLFINVTIMAGLTLAAYQYFLPQGVEVARSTAFTVMSFTQLFNLYNMRSLKKSILEIGVLSNIYITITMLSSTAITAAIIFVPYFQNIFGFGAIKWHEFILLAILSSAVLWVTELYKYGKRGYRQQEAV